MRPVLTRALLVLPLLLASLAVSAHAEPLFSAPFLSFGTGNLHHSVAIGDLNGGGKPDLAVANGGSSMVAVLLNAGVAPLIMAVSFDPRTLNLIHRGRWVTGFLEPASPFAAGDIDISSIRLNGTVPVDPAAPAAIGDHNGNSVPDLMLKFSREAVGLRVIDGDQVPVTVTGTLDSHPFAGTDHIRVLRRLPRGRETSQGANRFIDD